MSDEKPKTERPKTEQELHDEKVKELDTRIEEHKKYLDELAKAKETCEKDLAEAKAKSVEVKQTELTRVEGMHTKAVKDLAELEKAKADLLVSSAVPPLHALTDEELKAALEAKRKEEIAKAPPEAIAAELKRRATTPTPATAPATA